MNDRAEDRRCKAPNYRRFFEERVQPLVHQYDAALELELAAGVLG